jgi:hypothetical protein
MNRREDLEVVAYPNYDCSTSEVERSRLGSMIASWRWVKCLPITGRTRIITVRNRENPADIGIRYEL